MKKLLLFLIALIALSAQSWASFSYTYQGKTLYYNIVDGNAQVTYQNSSSPRYTNLTGSLTIPSSVTYNGTTYSVTSIGGAFYGCTGLTSVTIPNSVTSIDDMAFSGCSNLESIIVESGNTVYDSRNNCNAIIETSTNTLILGCKNTVIPNSVTSIGSSAFSRCSGLTSVTIPNSVTSIGDYAFARCSGLTGAFTIPNSVTSIGEGVFLYCTGLTSVTIPNSVTSIGDYAFYGCIRLTGALTIPNSVTSIGDYAFYGCSGLAGALTIPNSVTSIGSYAFYYCSGLTGTLTIPNSVTSIGSGAFANCSGLTGALTIPNSVTSISDSAFYGCSGLTGALTIPNSVTSIGSGAFANCSGLTAVYYTGDIAGWCGIDFWGYYANPLSVAHNLYINNSLVTDLVIPNGVTEIKNYAFINATCLTSVTIPNSVTYIGPQAFYNCSGLTGALTIPNSVTSIGGSAFYGCSGLTGTLTIPNSVTSIGGSAFYNCSALTSLTIGNSVTSIGNYAFSDCSGITEIHSLNPVPPTLGTDAFGIPNNTPVYIPCGRISYYTAADGWSRFTNFIESSAASFSAVSNDNTMGSVQILTMPTCTNPQAVVYAVANSGYQFDHWSDNSTSNPYSLTVNEDMELTAYFSPIGSQPTTYYTITVSANDAEMGTVTGGGSFAEGTTTTITATANSGYHFVQWQDGNTEASRSITVTADAEYTAYFAANGINYYTITVTSDDAEMGTVTGGGSFAEGTTTTITATANSGYHFVQWQDGNTEASRSITVTADAEYTAYFAANGANEYTITVIAQNPSMGSTTGSGTFAYGTATTITAEPYEGYYFVQWNDGNTQRIRTITVTGNATYTAYFDRSNGIDDITSDQIKIHSRGSEIVIEGAENSDALIYDVMGRIVHKGRIEGPIHVNAMGVYMVKIANHPSHKVVVK